MKSYQRIYHEIEEAILAGRYQPESFLPSENQLSTQYDVSRDTVRKALASLVANGYIQKIRGKGSIVIQREQLRFPLSGLTSYHELQRAYGYDSTTEVVSLEKAIITPELAESSGFSVGEEVWKTVRIRKIDGQKVILDKDLLLVKYIPKLTEENLTHSLYHYIESDLKLAIAYAEKEITIDNLTPEDHLLDLHENDINIVSVKSRVYLADAAQFQYTESRHQVDKFRFFDFARRNPSVY